MTAEICKLGQFFSLPDVSTLEVALAKVIKVHFLLLFYKFIYLSLKFMGVINDELK